MIRSGVRYVLPESKGGCRLPKRFNLGSVILDELLVIHHEEGMSQNIFGERGQRHSGSCQMCFGADNPTLL